MKISTEWLREWVEVDESPAALADRLTMAGLEVDSVTPAAPFFAKVVVGEIVACEQHPNADKLRVCQVSTGAESVQVVCGAPNARVGLKAPFAQVGAELPGDLTIRKAKLRGVESFGMLCSARELGLSEDSNGLLELPADAPVGQSLRDYLRLDDHVIEVDLTPNRSDCLGMVGIAREVGALSRRPVKPLPAVEVAETVADRIPVSLEAPAVCPRYVGRVIRNVNIKAETPIWMRERLRRAGVRSLGVVVDVTNYVMLELGQPMHAFDLGKIDGGIVVRMARDGETLSLLNGETVELRADTLVIADNSRALALAGIMGGEESAVGDDSRDIFLESAFFAPTGIAGRARQYGLHTESSHRFERGVDPNIQRYALDRATQLILELAGGEAGPAVEAAAEAELPRPVAVRLRQSRVQQMLGIDIPADEVVDILRRLGLAVTERDGGWDVVVPTYRFDLALEVDLIEELARVWGYHRVPVRRAAASLAMAPQAERRLSLRRLRSALVDRGYQEAITYSFVAPALQEALDPEQQPIALANPISADLAVMRTSLWPGLVQAVLHNQKRQRQRVRLFESGLRFRGGLDALVQERVIAGVATGSRLPEQWAAADEPVDFFDVKGDVEALLALTGEADAFRFEAAAHPALHPGQSAAIYRGERLVGWLGALHPEVQKRLDLAGATYVFELALEPLTQAKLPAFEALSRFPSIRRDLAVIVRDDTPAAAVLAVARSAAGELLRQAFVFDVYRGQGVEPGFKSLAIGLILQDSSRTLTDADVDEVIARVVVRLGQELGAVLRE